MLPKKLPLVFPDDLYSNSEGSLQLHWKLSGAFPEALLIFFQNLRRVFREALLSSPESFYIYPQAVGSYLGSSLQFVRKLSAASLKDLWRLSAIFIKLLRQFSDDFPEALQRLSETCSKLIISFLFLTYLGGSVLFLLHLKLVWLLHYLILYKRLT